MCKDIEAGISADEEGWDPATSLNIIVTPPSPKLAAAYSPPDQNPPEQSRERADTTMRGQPPPVSVEWRNLTAHVPTVNKTVLHGVSGAAPTGDTLPSPPAR